MFICILGCKKVGVSVASCMFLYNHLLSVYLIYFCGAFQSIEFKFCLGFMVRLKSEWTYDWQYSIERHWKNQYSSQTVIILW